jgi:hypothetical protein
MFDSNIDTSHNKYTTPTINGRVTVRYVFKNGDVLTIIGEKLELRSSTHRISYTLNSEYLHGFVVMFNHIKEKFEESGNRYNSHRSPEPKKAPKVENRSSERIKYDEICDKIKLRKEQLDKMDKSDTSRESLTHELSTYERVANRMKKKYRF